MIQSIAIAIYAFKKITIPLSKMHYGDELSSFVWNISFWTKKWKNYSFFYYSLLMSVKIIIITIIIKKNLICKAVSVYRMILYCWHYKIFSGNKKNFNSFECRLTRSENYETFEQFCKDLITIFLMFFMSNSTIKCW